VGTIEELASKSRKEHYANARIVTLVLYECSIRCPFCQAGENCYHPEQGDNNECPEAFKTCPLPKVSTAAIQIEINPHYKGDCGNEEVTT